MVCLCNIWKKESYFLAVKTSSSCLLSFTTFRLWSLETIVFYIVIELNILHDCYISIRTYIYIDYMNNKLCVWDRDRESKCEKKEKKRKQKRKEKEKKQEQCGEKVPKKNRLCDQKNHNKVWETWHMTTFIWISFPKSYRKKKMRALLFHIIIHITFKQRKIFPWNIISQIN